MLDSLRVDGWLDAFSTAGVASVVSTQLDLYAKCLASYKTPAIDQVLDCFRDKSPIAGYESLAKSYSSGLVPAPDIALLGSVRGLSDSLNAFGFSDCIPRGAKTFVRSLTRSSIERLSVARDITVNMPEKTLAVTGEEVSGAGEAGTDGVREVGVGAKTFNVISSSLGVFESLAEEGMMELLQRCSDELAFARDCKAGRFIWETIRDWGDGISFDKPVYYHARTKARGSAPYLLDDMARAPRMLVPGGRFNPPEKSYYYFSNSEYGACQEVGRHGDGEEIQIAELEGKGDVSLIDLSGEGRDTNYFLRYIRFPFTSVGATIPTEYLIPNYVAQCCRHAGFDGIKYYGSKDYSNYVVWEDYRLRALNTYIHH